MCVADAWRHLLAGGSRTRSHETTGTLHSGRGTAVGHSVGGAILINALADQPPPHALAAIVLIAAPFLGDGGWPTDDWPPSDDLGERLPRGVPIHVHHGLADAEVPASHADLYARAIPHAHVHRLPGRDHQLNNDLREIGEEIRKLEASE